MKQFLCIQLLVWFGWLSCIALAQLDISGAITGSASFPHVGITCLGNLAIFITSFLRKRLDLEMGARDFLVTITGPCNFTEKKNEDEQKTKVTCIRKLADFITSFLRRRLVDLEMGVGGLLATITRPCRFQEKNRNELIAVTPRSIPNASVVMLSNSAGMTNSSIRQFMEYIYNAHDVHSVLLKYDILKDAIPESSNCNIPHTCNCIVISKVERINMPQSLKELIPESPVVLPSLQCLENECHGCKRHLLDVEEVEGNLNLEFSSAVRDALDFAFTTPAQTDPICICIPVNDDKWTTLLVRSLKYKDQADKGATVAAADALQNYLNKTGEDRAEKTAEARLAEDRAEGRAQEIKYKTVSLIVIRFVEIFVNLLLTVLFKVDGFSSSLAARRAVRSYVVDSKGNGLPANVFLTSGLVVVKSHSVCQVLKFRGNRFFLVIVACVNLLCAIAWVVVLIAFNGAVGKWYAVHSMPPSKPRVAVIIAAVCIGIVIDCFEFSDLVLEIFRNGRDPKKSWEETWKKISKEIKEDKKNTLMILGVIVLEIAFAVLVALSLNNGIGRWVYGALQLLVWVKWVIGSWILGAFSPEYVPTTFAPRQWNDHGRAVLKYSSAQWVDEGTLVYCSSFFLNAVMVGVMGDWAGIWKTLK